MSEIDYSIDASNVLNKFYRKDKIVYVEGDDDVIFWEIIFSKIAELSIKCIPLGGKEEIAKKINKSIGEDVEYLIAKDSDYDYIQGGREFPFLLRTYGYSIENSMITREAIFKILKYMSKSLSKSVLIEKCDEWMKELDECLEIITIYDILCRQTCKSVSITPSACNIFLESKQSYRICSDKIEKYIESKCIKFTSEEIDNCKYNIKDQGLFFYDIVRGHFLFSMALRFITIMSKRSNKSGNMSNDSFFANLSPVFENNFHDGHKHFYFYQKQIKAIF
ncbi:DUF4435 domain-containing protein [Carnimonas nigrificans]|uniref:DUF4435 domain-containing protein n=1 Tax=Carnimonas nigrificans TaxID=64323 RepID=UPI00046E8B69|nr:DUF4435 domain-containing protein [Carnimonas nigrificans]